jgi:hypothetical protein
MVTSVMSPKMSRFPPSPSGFGNSERLRREYSDLDDPAPRAHTQSIWREVIQ